MKKVLLVSLMLLVPAIIIAQSSGLDPKTILKPLGNDWPTFSGDYTGKRYSSLKMINQSNVGNLSLAWLTPFTTGCGPNGLGTGAARSEEHTSELQSHVNLVCRLLLEKKKKNNK